MINRKGKIKMETVYIAGGCLWGVQHFFDTVPGVQMTEAGRANGTTSSLDGPYDGYAECVKVVYDEKNTSISELMAHLFEPAVFQQQLHIAVYGGLIERFHRHPPGFQYFLNAERAIQLAKNLFDRRPL